MAVAGLLLGLGLVWAALAVLGGPWVAAAICAPGALAIALVAREELR